MEGLYLRILSLILFTFIPLLSFSSGKIKGEIKETKENYLIVGTPILKGFEDSFIQLQAGKISVNVLAKSRQYLLMFTAQGVIGADIKFKRLEMIITKKGNTFDLKISINKVGTKISELKSVSANEIEKRFLLLQIRKSMYELIFGKDYLNKMKNKLEKENEKDKNEMSGLLKKGLGPKKVSNALAQIISDIQMSKLKLKNREKILKKELQKKTLAEKKLSNFKSNIQTAMRNERRKNEVDDKTDREFRGKQKDKKFISGNSETKQKTNQKDPIEGGAGQFGENAYQNNLFKKGKRPRGTRMFVEGMALNRVSNTRAILKNVKNDFFFTGLKGTGRVEVFPGLGDDFVFSFMYLKKQGQGKHTIPDIKNFHLLYLSTAGFLPFDVNMGIHLENQYFINILFDDGKGSQLYENQIAWFQLGAERVFNIWKFMIIPQVSVSKNIYSTSSVDEGVKLEATKLEFGGELGYKKFRLGLKYMQDTVVSTNVKSFTTTQTSTFLTLSYVFM